MSTAVEDAFADWLREFVTDGVPASGKHKPKKVDGRALGTLIQQRLNASLSRAAGDWAVFLVSGASNALGSSTGGDLTTNPNVYVYRPTTGTIEVANPTLSPFNGNNNAGFQAAKRYQEQFGGRVLMILVAQGSTPLTEWNPGGSQWTKITNDVPAALALIGQTVVDRVMWIKGEAEYALGTIVGMRAMEEVLDQMRALSWWLKGHTYVVASEMTTSRENSQRGMGLAYRLLAEKTSDFVMISSFDIALDASQKIHYSGDGLTELGKRLAETASLPYGHAPRATFPRFAPGSIQFVIDTTPGDDVDFTDFVEAFDFFSTIQPGLHAVVTVTVRGKHSPIFASLRPALINPEQWFFEGETVGGFTQPPKGDLSVTPADALTFLRTKYLTEIEVESNFLTLQGNIGCWKRMLFSVTGPGAVSGALRSRDNAASVQGAAAGVFYGEDIAFHGWTGSLSGPVFLEDGGKVKLTRPVFSHSRTHVTCVGGEVTLIDAVFAHSVTTDVRATDGGRVICRGATTTSASASGYSTDSGGFIDATGSENTGAVDEGPDSTIMV